MIYSRYETNNRSSIKRIYNKVVPKHIRDLRSNYIQKKVYESEARKVISNIHGGGIFPKTIEIETVNRCNGTCSFCPINKNDDTRPYAKMEEELFEKILNELMELNYSGNLQLFSNNEPFLDVRIIDWAHKARKSLPNAYMILYTNGTLLSIEKVTQIIPSLDKLIIDNYSDDLCMIPPVKQLYEYCTANRVWMDKIEIHLRKQNEVLTTRGGNAPNKKVNRNKKIGQLPCIYPFTQMVIRPDGKVSLCCNDALGKTTLGDVSLHSIKEIWQNENYKNIRNQITKGRNHLEICKNCDTIHLLFEPEKSL